MSLNNLLVVAVNTRPDFFSRQYIFENIFMRFKIDMVLAWYRREQIHQSCNEDSNNQFSGEGIVKESIWRAKNLASLDKNLLFPRSV